MAKTTRLFHRFREHETVTFLGFKREGRRMSYRDSCGRELSHPVQAGLEIDFDAIAPGTPLRVQFGEATNWTSSMMGGGRYLKVGNRHMQIQAYTGCHCVTAIAHPDPRVPLVAALAMAHGFGPEVAADHLRYFGDGASTLQTRYEYPKERWSRRSKSLPVGMRNEKGVLMVSAELGEGVRLSDRFVVLTGRQLPAAVLEALPGRAASSVVSHPILDHPDIVVAEAGTTPDGLSIRLDLDCPMLTPTEAIAVLPAPPALPMAA